MNPDKAKTIANQVSDVILNDFAHLFETSQGIIGKSILIAVGIEFLGACLDKQHLKATARSEIRFNQAILKLFPGRYHPLVRKESIPNLYLEFRCPVIHQFRVEKSIHLVSGDDSGGPPLKHLSRLPDGSLVINIREFFNDLKAAADKYITPDSLIKADSL